MSDSGCLNGYEHEEIEMDTNGFGPDEKLVRLTEKLVNHLGIADTHYQLEIDYAKAGFPQGFRGEKDRQFKAQIEVLGVHDFLPIEPELPRDGDNVVGDRWQARIWGIPITFTNYRVMKLSPPPGIQAQGD
jgi:hypothetical protein